MYPPPDDQPQSQPIPPPPNYPPPQNYPPPPPNFPPAYNAPPGSLPPGYGAPPAFGAPNAYGVPNAAPYGVVTGDQSNGMATASLVLGIVGIFFGTIANVLAVIFGHIALNKIKENPALESTRGQAMAGLILGYVFGGLYLLCIVGIVALALASPHVGTTTTP